jgi:hypothetical protein
MKQQFTLYQLMSFDEDISCLEKMVENEYALVSRIIRALELIISSIKIESVYVDGIVKHFLTEEYLKNDSRLAKIKNLEIIKNKFIFIQNNLEKRHCNENKILDVFDNDDKNNVFGSHLHEYTKDVVGLHNIINKNEHNFVDRLKNAINKEVKLIIDDLIFNKSLYEEYLDIYNSDRLSDLYCENDSLKTNLDNMNFMLSELNNMKIQDRKMIDDEEEKISLSF